MTTELIRVSEMTDAQRREMTELVVLANADRRELFSGPRLAENSLTEDYWDNVAILIRDGDKLAATGALETKDDGLWIFILAVQPSLRGQGLGQRLIEIANRYAIEHGIELLVLQVVVTGRLVAFYERIGFQEEKRENLPQGHWGSTEPFELVTMTKRAVGSLV